MFDFEKLEVYQVVKQLNTEVLQYLASGSELDIYLKEEWKKSSLNVQLYLIEGIGTLTRSEKKEFYKDARSSVFDCVTFLDLLKGLGQVSEEEYQRFYKGYESMSKMLLGMYRSHSHKPEGRSEKGDSYITQGE